MTTMPNYFTRSAEDIPVRLPSSDSDGLTKEDMTVPRFHSPTPLAMFKQDKQDHGMEGYQELPPKHQSLQESPKNYIYKDIQTPRHTRFHRTSIGDWRFMETVGQGSMGKVKLAQNDNDGKLVAVKVVNRALKVFLLRQEHIHSPRTTKELKEREAALAKEQARDKRTVREAVLGQLMCHPNICKLYEWHILSNHYYLIFEYVNGGQLLDYIIQNGLLTEKKSREFARAIGSVLLYLHKNNIVHRDLKIENIMIDNKGELKMIDFGLSNFYDSRSLLKTYCGSLYFAAPELLCATPYIGPEIDIWSFGVIIYVLVCGKVPFDDSDSHKLHQKIKRGKFTYPDFVTSNAKSLLNKMLVVDPKKRATLPKILEHRWMNEGFVSPVDCNIPNRPPLTVDTLDWNVIQEMEKLSLVESAQFTKESLEDIITDNKYLTLSEVYWSILQSDDMSHMNNSDMPTVAFHPLLSQYYLTSEYMQRTQNITALTKVPTGQSVVTGTSGNETNGNATDSNGYAPDNRYGYLPLKLRRMSEPHVSPTRKTHYDPSADYVIHEDSTIIRGEPERRESRSSKGKKKIKKLLRRLSVGFRSAGTAEENGDDIGPEDTTVVTTTDVTGNNPLDIGHEDDYVVPLTAPETYQKKKPQGRSKSVGNERRLLVTRDHNISNGVAPLQQIISEKDIVKMAQEAPPDSMPSIQYTNSFFTSGVLSVQTTSSKPLAVVRFKIINALKMNNIQYQEVKGGFHCSAYKLGNVVDTDILQTLVDNNIVHENDATVESASMDSPTHFDTISEEEPLNITTETVHQFVPSLVVDTSHNNDTMVPLSPTGTSTMASAGKVTTETSKQDTVISSPITWNEKHPFIANELSKKIVFEIFIAKIKFLNLIGIHLKKISGDSWEYKEIAAKLIKDMNL
ncbi:similar to Saccharomyces cerevisiae YDR122W KIN1 Serine/threonine protein kinase involved in regulation of exocytosis [Maudiozyma saulgeensis]|uniref:non-specific serine/threonine protein kinase n=1 Tax=Maudiozyma saulgeensis TaxID=1789683 RepID=A0A1X7R618_9SACH|nr:similar to Saccharomyces cerevisiae YDR122W KIN1 Serine/threonine protein kinase involved in regulation of exocytosis [Kazachstania saulgeensis]